MPFLNRVDRRIWWLTSKAADRSSNISNEAVLASLRFLTTESKAVSEEYPLLKPDWLLSRRLFCVRKAVTWLKQIVQVFLQWKVEGKPVYSSLKSWVKSGFRRDCLNAEGKIPVWRDVLMMWVSEGTTAEKMGWRRWDGIGIKRTSRMTGKA